MKLKTRMSKLHLTDKVQAAKITSIMPKSAAAAIKGIGFTALAPRYKKKRTYPAAQYSRDSYRGQHMVINMQKDKSGGFMAIIVDNRPDSLQQEFRTKVSDNIREMFEAYRDSNGTKCQRYTYTFLPTGKTTRRQDEMIAIMQEYVDTHK